MTDLQTGTTETPDTPPPARRYRLWIPMTVLIVGAVVLAVVFGGRFGKDPRLVASPLVGNPLPDLTLPYLEQEGSLTFSDLEGRVLVVNFWASWCFPCRAEHPLLTAASTAYEEDGVHFVGIVYQDSPEAAIAFLDELGRGENYSYVVDTDSRATVEMGVFGVPETYFVGRDGVVKGKYQGELTRSILVGTIDDILAGRTPEL